MKLTVEIRGNSVTTEFEPNQEYASDVISVMAAAVEKLDAIQAAEAGAAEASMRLYEDMVKGYDEKKLRCEALEADVADRDKRIEALKGLVLEAEATVKARECRIGELEVLLASREAVQKPCWEAEPPFKIGSFVTSIDPSGPKGTFAVERVRRVDGGWWIELAGLQGWWLSEWFKGTIFPQKSDSVKQTMEPEADSEPEIESTDRYGKPLVVGDIVKVNGVAYAFAGGSPLGLTVAYINDPDKILLFKNSDVEFVKHPDDRI